MSVTVATSTPAPNHIPLSGELIKFGCSDSNITNSPSEIIEIEKAIATQSKIIASMLLDLGGENLPKDVVIPLNIIPETMKNVVVFAKHYLENPSSEDASKKLELSEWEKKYCSDFTQKELFSVILAANFLDFKPLLDVTCLFVALKLKSMTPEEIRKEYNITKEFTPEEEELARKEFEEMILQTTAKK